MVTTTIQTITLDNDLLKEVENFKSAWHYQTSSQVIEELVRRAIKSLKEEADDEYLLAIALERKKRDTGVRYSEEDIMRKYGISEADLENAEDVEIE